MPIGHSLESMVDYERSARPGLFPGLQMNSFRAIARDAVSAVRKRTKTSKPKTVAAADKRDSSRPQQELQLRRPLTPPQVLAEDAHTPTDTNTVPAPAADMKVLDQSQSQLFTRLPLEIRQQIYAYAAANSTVHIRTTHGGTRYSHYRCKCVTCLGSGYYHSPNQPNWKREWHCDKSKWTEGNKLDITLLRTCRKMYGEAISVLYAENAFCFQSLHVLQGWLATLLPQRRDVLRKIHIDLSYNVNSHSSPRVNGLAISIDQRTCHDVFTAVAHLPILQELEVRIHPNASQPFAPLTHEFLSPLSVMRGQDKGRLRVVLYVPDGFQECEWLVSEPFEIRKFDTWSWWSDIGKKKGLFVF
jgi:hypothetical protein